MIYYNRNKDSGGKVVTTRPYSVTLTELLSFSRAEFSHLKMKQILFPTSCYLIITHFPSSSVLKLTTKINETQERFLEEK